MNIKAKHDRIAHGSNEHMRKPSEPGAPTTEDFEKARNSQADKNLRNSDRAGMATAMNSVHALPPAK